MNVSSAHFAGRTLLKYLIGAAVLLAAAWLLAGQARAETGLTVEVERNQNLLVASATTVEGDEVNGDSWRWLKTDECSVDAFADDSAEYGADWTVTIGQDDLGETYCFYVEDSADRQAVGSIYVHYPKISVRQNNDQLVAEVANLEEDGIDVDDGSWHWFRYHAVDNSRFGCEPQHFELDDGGLMQASEAAEAFQVEMYGEVQVEVYPLQQDAYLAGQGSTASLTAADEGLNFCFRVSDTAGITNYKHITVGAVTVDNETGSKPATDPGVGSEPATDDSEGVGQVVTGDDSAGPGELVEETPAEDGGNVVRNIGLALLAVAIIIGIFMLIKRSQNTSDDEEDIQA